LLYNTTLASFLSFSTKNPRGIPPSLPSPHLKLFTCSPEAVLYQDDHRFFLFPLTGLSKLPKSKHSPYFVQQIHLILGFIACNFDQMCSKQIKQIIKIKRSFGKKSLSVPPSRQLYLNQCVIC
jgi:hypothetical protein